MRIRNDGVATRRVGEDVMVLDLRTSQYFAVGGSGAFILDLLRAGDVTEEQIVAALTTEFPVAAEQARVDVAAFVVRLDEAGLLLAS